MFVFITILYYICVTAGNNETNPEDSTPTTKNSTYDGPSNYHGD